MVSNVGPCGFCGREASLKCAKCQLIFYCSRKCQKKNYGQHENNCVDFYLNKFKPVVAKQSNDAPQASISDDMYKYFGKKWSTLKTRHSSYKLKLIADQSNDVPQASISDGKYIESTSSIY